jgi:hypothetical protein
MFVHMTVILHSQGLFLDTLSLRILTATNVMAQCNVNNKGMDRQSSNATADKECFGRILRAPKEFHGLGVS